MNRHYELPLRDAQQASPVASCSVCYEEIYRYDETAMIGGEFVHEWCMTPDEREDYPTYPAISFFDEAC